VLAVRRHPAADPAPADAQWGLDRLPELIERSDWLVLAAPLTPATRGLIGRAQLARLRPHAVVVNLGRGPVVDEAALADGLAAGRIAGAALDVFDEEPLPPESPLWSMPHVIVTPHVGGPSDTYARQALPILDENLRRFLDGERKNLVNLVWP
jgi:phosphoglycerate dehydrogenase-like enzyme